MKTGCIKTGCDVWIESHNALAHGDLYRFGDEYKGFTYVFRAINQEAWQYGNEGHSRAHCVFLTDNWDDSRMAEFDNYRTILVQSPYVHLTPAFRDWLGDE